MESSKLQKESTEESSRRESTKESSRRESTIESSRKESCKEDASKEGSSELGEQVSRKKSSQDVVVTFTPEIQREESSSGVMDIELVNSVSSNPLVDRIFKSAITFVVCILFSGVLFALSKLGTIATHLLEVTAAVIFIVTMILFVLAGLLFMCSTFIMGDTKTDYTKTDYAKTDYKTDQTQPTNSKLSPLPQGNSTTHH